MTSAPEIQWTFSSPFFCSALFRPVELLLGAIPDPRQRPAWTVPVFCLSVLIVGAGTYILVRAGIHLARLLQVDPAIVALTIIAGGMQKNLNRQELSYKSLA